MTDINEATNQIRAMLEPSEPTDSANAQPEAQQYDDETGADTLENSDTPPPSRRRKAKLGDREVELEILTEDVDPDEIVKGIMMENDYRQKTMSLADERRYLDAQKGQLDTVLADLQDQIMMDASELESEEMRELKEIDPTSYWEKFEAVKKRAEKFKQYREQRNYELQQQQQIMAQQEMARYTDVIPEWLNEEVKAADLKNMAMTMAAAGFSDAEMQNIWDSRHINLLRKAALYDQIKSQNLEEKRVKKQTKSVAPSSNLPPDGRTKKGKAMDRLKKTGKVTDAQKAIQNILFGG